MLEMVVTTVKISMMLPSWYSKIGPKHKNAQENSNAGAGTPLMFNLPKMRGATLFLDKPNSIRPVENMPPLAEDNAEASTTKLIRLAAIGMPIMVNMFTNGLTLGLTTSHGVTVIITAKAST